jgi:uncharacterized membrane protein required for colicin V production
VSLADPFLRGVFEPALLRSSDGGVVVVLALFALWGAHRGAARQVFSLGVVIGSLYLAGVLAPKLVPTITKLTRLEANQPLAVAWTLALFGCLVVGALLLRLVCSRLADPADQSSASRWLGGLIGLAKGAVVAVIVGYAVLASSGNEPAPALSRPHATPTATTKEVPVPATGLIARLRGSVSAGALARGAGLLRAWFHVPPYFQQQVDRVNQQLDPTSGPSGSA